MIIDIHQWIALKKYMLSYRNNMTKFPEYIVLLLLFGDHALTPVQFSIGLYIKPGNKNTIE